MCDGTAAGWRRVGARDIERGDAGGALDDDGHTVGTNKPFQLVNAPQKRGENIVIQTLICFAPKKTLNYTEASFSILHTASKFIV